MFDEGLSWRKVQQSHPKNGSKTTSHIISVLYTKHDENRYNVKLLSRTNSFMDGEGDMKPLFYLKRAILSELIYYNTNCRLMEFFAAFDVIVLT